MRVLASTLKFVFARAYVGVYVYPHVRPLMFVKVSANGPLMIVFLWFDWLCAVSGVFQNRLKCLKFQWMDQYSNCCLLDCRELWELFQKKGLIQEACGRVFRSP